MVKYHSYPWSLWVVFLQPGKVLLPACDDQYSAQWEVLSGVFCSHSSLLSATLCCQVQLCWSPGLSAPSHQLREFTSLCLGSPSLHWAQKLSQGSKLGAILILTSFSPRMASFFSLSGITLLLCLMLIVLKIVVSNIFSGFSSFRQEGKSDPCYPIFAGNKIHHYLEDEEGEVKPSAVSAVRCRLLLAERGPLVSTAACLGAVCTTLPGILGPWLLVAGSLHRYWTASPESNWVNLSGGSRLQASSWIRMSSPWFSVCQGWLRGRMALTGGQGLGPGLLRGQCNQNGHVDFCWTGRLEVGILGWGGQRLGVCGICVLFLYCHTAFHLWEFWSSSKKAWWWLPPDTASQATSG